MTARENTRTEQVLDGYLLASQLEGWWVMGEALAGTPRVRALLQEKPGHGSHCPGGLSHPAASALSVGMVFTPQLSLRFFFLGLQDHTAGVQIPNSHPLLILALLAGL